MFRLGALLVRALVISNLLLQEELEFVEALGGIGFGVEQRHVVQSDGVQFQLLARRHVRQRLSRSFV